MSGGYISGVHCECLMCMQYVPIVTAFWKAVLKKLELGVAGLPQND